MIEFLKNVSPRMIARDALALGADHRRDGDNFKALAIAHEALEKVGTYGNAAEKELARQLKVVTSDQGLSLAAIAAAQNAGLEALSAGIKGPLNTVMSRISNKALLSVSRSERPELSQAFYELRRSA